jgi:hypothetical protein
MTTKINRPRPSTRLGLASDVRSGDYMKRIKSAVKRPLKTAKARTALPDRDRRVPR